MQLRITPDMPYIPNLPAIPDRSAMHILAQYVIILMRQADAVAKEYYYGFYIPQEENTRITLRKAAVNIALHGRLDETQQENYCSPITALLVQPNFFRLLNDDDLKTFSYIPREQAKSKILAFMESTHPRLGVESPPTLKMLPTEIQMLLCKMSFMMLSTDGHFTDDHENDLLFY